METKINKISDTEHELEVTFDYDEIKPEMEEAYKEERKEISLPGFRKGKVPVEMIKKLYGDAIEYKASEKIANKKFWDVVDEQNLKPVSVPQMTDLNFDIGKQLSFKIKYEVKPDLDVKDYKDLEIQKPLFKVREEDIEKEVNHLIQTYATYEEAEKVEDKNYQITVDLQRLDENNVPIVGQRNENVAVNLTDYKVNPQIVENAKGKSVGDSFNFKFSDSHSHGDETHTEEFNYRADIKKIEKIVDPEINEELIKKISRNKAKTVEDLKDHIRDNYKKYFDEQSENIYTNSLLSQVIKNNDFEPSKGYVDSIRRSLVEMEKENAERSGNKNFDEKAAAEHLQPRAVWNAKWQIVMESIARKENLKVVETDFEALAEEEAKKTGISKDKLLKFYKEANRTESILEEKVIQFLKENNKAVEVDADEIVKENKEE